MIFTFHSATVEHAHDMAPRMRAADVAELQASHALEPLKALLVCLEESDECFSALHGREVAYMWGLRDTSHMAELELVGIPSGTPSASVWLLTSNLVDRFPKAFIQHCRAEIPRLLAGRECVWNLVHSPHATAQRWAARIGFEVRPPMRAGALGHLFHPIVLRRESAPCASLSPP